jgi:hypothetical protein
MSRRHRDGVSRQANAADGGIRRINVNNGIIFQTEHRKLTPHPSMNTQMSLLLLDSTYRHHHPLMKAACRVEAHSIDGN